VEEDFGRATTPPARAPTVAGFTFFVGDTITKIDKLIYQPDPTHVRELMALILEKGAGCETEHLRCDDQGVFRGYVNTQCQLGGSGGRVNRTDASKQSTSFTQVNLAVDARRNPINFKALAAGHEYSYRTKKVVTIDLAAGTATVGVDSSKTKNVSFLCSECKYKKTLPANATEQIGAIEQQCPRCKKFATVERV